MKASTEKTELALRQASTEVTDFVSSIQAEVEEIESQYSSIVPDASSKEGYDHCKQVRRDVLPVKTALENARKTLKAPILEAGKLVDSSLKPLIDRLEAVYAPFVKACQDVDNAKKRAEEERKAKIQAEFDHMNGILMKAIGESSSVIEALIDDLTNMSIDPDTFQDRTEEAAKLHFEVTSKLSDLLVDAINREERETMLREQEQAHHDAHKTASPDVWQEYAEQRKGSIDDLMPKKPIRTLGAHEVHVISAFVAAISQPDSKQFNDELNKRTAAYFKQHGVQEAA
ncbi:hypothetical protein LJ739_06920 [Aestuariibacter halophilus]|uniref:Uncharacterized protein n=1 Tax=Fluctibacter halophilus TaxID=226011 RepID=A0ABS8G8E9_9ALTE|nr:hypothetical protein [Aestuariibacter halophilus]MCC2615969.1 hypothetical protein [Aestuariibacter halophilus]